MKLLSIDVGIKNLAYCLFEKDEESDYYKIIKWDIVNISEKKESKCLEIENKKVCDKQAKFIKDGKCYCTKHSKQTKYIQPTQELTQNLNKLKITELLDLSKKYGIYHNIKIKKNELIQVINQFVEDNCFELVDNVNAFKINLVTIGKNINIKFNQIFENHIIDIVIIENQLSPIAKRMKTIQGMISQYFIMKNDNIDIDFINSSNKLKVNMDGTNNINTLNNKNKLLESTLSFVEEDIKDDKKKYSDRKKEGIKKCLELITMDYKYNDWTTFFNNHKKKDDLSDCFLQGIWYINKLESKK
jgi:hypothetical protein